MNKNQDTHEDVYGKGQEKETGTLTILGYFVFILFVIISVIMLAGQMFDLPTVEFTYNPTNTDTETFYIFPEGLTPITNSHAFWLCQNEAGEYLPCSPVIETRPVTQTGEGETDD